MREPTRAFTRSPFRGAVGGAPVATPRYWLKSSVHGSYISISPVVILTTNWYFSIDAYLPSGGAAYDTLVSDGSYYVYVYNTGHAIYPNGIELRTNAGIYRIANAFPSDRSVSYELKLVSTSNNLEVFIDGVSVGTIAIGGSFRADEFTYACAGCVFGNLNFNGAVVFPLTESSGVPVASVGSNVTAYVGAGHSWVYGISPETAV